MRQAQFKRPLSVAFRQDMFTKIKQKSDEDKISMAEWIRQVIDLHLSGKKKDT